MSEGARTAWQQGSVLGGRYRLVSVVGSGAFAEVWRAHDTRLGRDVAIKILSGPAARDPAQRSRVEREARALARLSHPNLLRVYDYDEEPSPNGPPVPYIVMELVPGPDLATHLARRGPLEPQEAVTLMRGVLAGVAQAHAHGIVHGDLKPANILLGPDGPKVGDFGVARVLTEETGATVPVATPAYAAPEVLAGQRPGPPSDVYSAACIAFEALCGRRPFEGSTVWELARQHTESPPPTVRQVRPELPAALDEVLGRALAKEPSHRYLSAEAFATALAQALHPPATAPLPPPDALQTAVVAPQPTEPLPPPAPRGPKASGRLQRVAAGALRVPAGLVVAVAGVAGLLYLQAQPTATATVPRLVGLDAASATEQAQRAGFRVEPRVVDAGGRANTVVAQSPPPDTPLAKGSAIRIDVTKGAPQVLVPDLAGAGEQEARAALASAGLVVGEVRFVAGGRRGAVVGTIPPPGTSVDRGSAVTLIVSQGGEGDERPDKLRGRGRGRRDG